MGYIYLPGSIVPSPEQEPFRSCVDSAPADGTTYHNASDIISLDGWALTTYGNGEGVTCINLCINGADRVGCERHQRKEVADTFPDYPNGVNSGFRVSFRADLLTPGANTLSFRAYATNTNRNDILIGDFGSYTVYYTPGEVPMGYVDVAKGGKGSIEVAGWSFDRDDISKQVTVQVYADGPMGTGKLLASFPADNYYSGVDKVYGCGEYHGFEKVITTDLVGSHTLYFYGLDINGENHGMIGSRTVNVEKNEVPMGWVDVAEGRKGSIEVAGWSFDRDDISKQVTVQVYADGPMGTGKLLASFPADNYYDGVDRAHGCGKYHGFEKVIATDLVGSHTLYFYGLDLNGENHGMIGSRTVNIEKNEVPMGWVDVAKGGTDCIEVAGWSFDRDDISKQVTVQVYADGPMGTGKLLASFPADNYYDGVDQAHGCGKYHGFEKVITTDLAGSHTLYFYGLDLDGDSHGMIGSRTVEIRRGSAPQGELDSVESEKPGTVMVYGWAVDMDDKSAPVDIHVYIGGDAGSGARCQIIKADRERPDVEEAISGIGKNHGFRHELPTDLTSPQEVYVYAIDRGSRQGNVLLGHKSVTIGEPKEEPHIHEYTEEIIKPATCASPGEKKYTCACGGSYIEAIDRLPHTVVEDRGQEATCDRDGLTEGSHCSVCGEIITAQQIIERLNHRNTAIRGQKDATCVSTGYTGDTYCEDCGAKLADGEYTKRLEHTIGEEAVLKKATESEAGIIIYTCEVCNMMGFRIVPAIGAEQLKEDQSHNHEYIVETVKAPTYNSPGEEVHVCACGEYFAMPIQMGGTQEAKYKITYHLDGGVNDALNPQEYTGGTQVTLRSPSREGYTFQGWYTEDTFENEVAGIEEGSTGDKDFYAKWQEEEKPGTKPEKVTGIRLDTASKLLIRGESFTLRAMAEPSSIPVGDLIWESSDAGVAAVDGGGTVTAQNPGTAMITVSVRDSGSVQAACTVTVPYSITYKLNRGSNSEGNPSYYYNQTVALKNPARKGYTFGGWYTDSKYRKKVTYIPGTAGEDITLYAKWDKVAVKKAAIRKIVNRSRGKAKITLAKVPGAKGYKVLYSTDKKLKKGVKAVTAKSAGITLPKLKKGKRYYVKACAYKLDSQGSKVYGKYSNVKEIKIKR